LLVIGVDRKETFGIISPEYYHIIIERAKVISFPFRYPLTPYLKDLLSTLYERVVENENPAINNDVFLTSAPIEYKQDGKRPQILPAVQTISLETIPPHQVISSGFMTFYEYFIKARQKLGRPNHFLTVEQRQHKQELADKNAAGINHHERQKLLYSVLSK